MAETDYRYINPYKLFTGAFIPTWLLLRQEVSMGAKVCYARLCQYAGENGECFPKQESLAAEIGIKSNRQVIRYLQELEQHGLIKVERIGKTCSNRYKFLYHKWISDVTNCHITIKSDVTDMSLSDVTDMSHHIERESVEENHKERDIFRDINKKELTPNGIFELFWKEYPGRNGQKLGKKEAREKYITILKSASPALILQAVRNYKLSKTATDGFARDAVRFLKKDYWRGWLIQPEIKKKEKDDDRLAFLRKTKASRSGVQNATAE